MTISAKPNSGKLASEKPTSGDSPPAEPDFEALRNRFDLPDGRVYLDGNSLGAMPRHVPRRIQELLHQQWATDLISSWNAHEWIDLPQRTGDRIGRLVGAAPGQVICVDSVSVNIFKLLALALSLRPDRKVILTAEQDFPTDTYIAQGLVQLLGQERCELRRVPMNELEVAMDEDVAIVMLTQVNYRTGELAAMQDITASAHANGSLVLWDLAHSAGVVDMDLDALGVDMAVGCGYKFLNGGPGAPAFAYVNRKHHERLHQPLAGWLGHRDPFAFSADYEPAPGVAALQAGTPPIISLVALDAALDVFDDVRMATLRERSLALTSIFINGLEQAESLKSCRLVTPAVAERRGSQVSLAHEQAWGVTQALIDAGVIVDFRAPDIVRFGFSPLYNTVDDVETALACLATVISEERFRDSRFAHRPRVT